MILCLKYKFWLLTIFLFSSPNFVEMKIQVHVEMQILNSALQPKLFQEAPTPKHIPDPATSTTSSLAGCAGAPAPATGVCDAAGLTKSSVRQDGSKVRNPTELLKLLVDSFREYCPIINPGCQKRKPKYVLNQVLSRHFVKSLLAYFINMVTL